VKRWASELYCSWHAVSARLARSRSTGCATACCPFAAAASASSRWPSRSSMISPSRSTSLTTSCSGRSSTTVTCRPPRCSRNSRNFEVRSWNVFSNGTALSPRQLSVKVLGDHARSRQPLVQRKARGADQKSLGHHAGVVAGGQSPCGLFDHLLLFRREADYFRQPFVSQLGVGPITDRVHHHLDRVAEGVEQSRRDVADARI